MIDTQSIRKKILDLALRGKLTEQLPEDGTAEELYRLIQQEKAVLIKAGLTKKNKPLPPVTIDKAPFEIPENWKWVRWGDLSEQIQYGYIASAQSTGQIKMVRISDIQGNKVIWKNVPYCDIDEESIDIYKLHQNDILFARTGGTVGKSYLVENVDTEAVFAGYLIRTSYSKRLSAKYIKYFMDSDLYWKQLQDGTTATAQPNCNGQTLSKMILPLPPAAEQMRIVEKLQCVFSMLDTIDTLQSQYKDNLATLKSKIIDAGIQGKLTEQLPEDGTAEELYQQIQQEKAALEKAGKIKKSKPLPPISEEEKPFEIPENWKWVKLGNVITLVSGTDFKPEDYNDAGIGMPYMTGASNIENDKLIINRWTPCPRNIAHEGELLLVCKGSGFGKLVICNVSEAHIARQFMSIRPYSGVDVNYVKAVMTNSFQIIKEAGKGLIPGVDRDTVLNIPLPLPPLSEQKRIVAKLEELLPLCEGK